MPFLPWTPIYPMPTPERRLRRLLDTSMLINSATSLDGLLDYIIDSVTDLLGCEGGAVLLFDEASESLRFVASTGSDQDSLARIPVPLNDSVAGRVYVFAEPVVDNDTRSSGRHFVEVGKKVKLETRSLLAVPLSVEGRTIGVLEAINKREGVFSVQDEHDLGMFANQAALAIRNEGQNQQVREAYRRLQEFEHFRSEFLAIASHELRTPLSILMQSLDILQMETREELHLFVGDARVAGDRLKAIVESMTQLETLRISSTTLSQEAVDLVGVLNALVEGNQNHTGLERIQWVWSPPDNAPLVRSNVRRVEQILENGLRNALAILMRQEKAGCVDIGLFATESDVVVRIRDNGPGLDEALIERVFDEFFQTEDHLTRTGSGLGIGLTVARKLARMDRGEVWLEQAEGGTGIVFCLRLPIL